MNEEVKMQHIRGAVAHPQTQGKIERYHKTMKNVVKLEHYFLPEQLNESIKKFVQFYNNKRYHESFLNLTPADMCFGRAEQILKQREIIKIQSMQQRYFLFQQQKINTI